MNYDSETLIDVKYIGPRQTWIEKRYRSGLTFTNGQTRAIPESLANKLLRHADLFVRPQGAGQENAQAHNQDHDDTREILAKAKQKLDREKDEENRLQDLRDRIMTMDKDALADFAYIKYRQKIDKRRSTEALREQVIAFVDQFGAV